MEIRLSGHGAYLHQYHVVWVPKYRKEILTGALKVFVEKELITIQEYHPDVEIENYSIQKDHIHLVFIIPPRYSVSGIIGKISNANNFKTMSANIGELLQCFFICRCNFILVQEK